MANALSTIESYAQSIARSLDILVYSLEGLFEVTVRDNPSLLGLRTFMVTSQSLSDEALDTVVLKLHEAIDVLKRSLSTSELDHFDSAFDIELFDGVAYDAFGAFFAQARTAYAKRLREFIMARASGTDTFNAEPKIMTRNGRRWNFSDFAYVASRGLLMDWYNGVKISHLSDQGIEQFTVFTTEPDAEYGPYKVSDYPELAPELFHPRAPRLVGGAYVST